MRLLSLSAGHKLFCAGTYFISENRVFVIQNRAMLTWETQKEKFLKMSVDMKRDHYRAKEYKTLDDIKTWPQYVEKRGAGLAKRIPPSEEAKIAKEKNKELMNKISLFRGDITTLEIDCIVNAANSSLLGGGGVDGAIHSAAGSHLKEECKTLGGCKVGEAKITGGFKLPAKYVIHTVGPQGEQPAKLKSCYKSCLELMLEKKLKSIAFPCISTGIYGYPPEPAAHIAAMEVRRHLEEHGNSVEWVIFCVFLESDLDLYEGILQSYFPIN